MTATELNSVEEEQGQGSASPRSDHFEPGQTANDQEASEEWLLSWARGCAAALGRIGRVTLDYPSDLAAFRRVVELLSVSPPLRPEGREGWDDDALAEIGRLREALEQAAMEIEEAAAIINATLPSTAMLFIKAAARARSALLHVAGKDLGASVAESAGAGPDGPGAPDSHCQSEKES